MKLKTARPRPGRPRAFQAEKALEAALRVFWQHGYEGTSLSELTAAMGINRPSLYAAFGNKEALFRQVVDRYADASSAMFRAAGSEPTAERVVARLLRDLAENLGDPKRPRGCLLVQSALACGKSNDRVRRALVARREANVALLRKRFEQARAEGDLPATVEAGDLARYLSAVTAGLAVQAANGAGRGELRRVAELASLSWKNGN